jgi:hypothetical protein
MFARVRVSCLRGGLFVSGIIAEIAVLTLLLTILGFVYLGNKRHIKTAFAATPGLTSDAVDIAATHLDANNIGHAFMISKQTGGVSQ